MNKPEELAHRLQLAKWCALHKMPVPVGPVVDAFVAAMGSTHHYGVEETWDAFCWFRHGFNAAGTQLLRTGWRYRYGASAWKYVDREEDCNPGDGYERERVYVLRVPDGATADERRVQDDLAMGGGPR